MRNTLHLLCIALSICILSTCATTSKIAPSDLAKLNGEWGNFCFGSVETPEEIECADIGEPIIVFELEEGTMKGTVTEKYVYLRRASETGPFEISVKKGVYTIEFQGSVFHDTKAEIVEISEKKLMLKSPDEDFYRVHFRK